jgi:hypothetical protein
MSRMLVLFAFALSTTVVGVGMVACGGNDKPPLTPDGVDPALEGADAGAPVAPAPGPK